MATAATVAGYGSVYLTYFQEGPIESYSDLTRNNAQAMAEYRRRLIDRGFYKLPMNLKRSHISLAHTVDMVDATLNASEHVLREMRRGSSAAVVLGSGAVRGAQ